ncbi:MAG TPA: ABC transporter ATP-binding protein [Candidatus Nanoarchaeia archaeon]|nr:ABC transporter ATP-binding protein [Candidatus Nanoarchaeia archaeon]
MNDLKLIELKEVSKSFGKNSILGDVNLIIEEGDILGIIGRSGSGKTTLLNLVAGFLEPSEGEVLHHFKAAHGPESLHQNLHKIKDLIGYAPQHNSFYPKLTVLENLLHFGQLYKLPKETILNNIKGLLEATDLLSHQNKLAEHLSGGMQKRLDIACSLVHKPKILVLDEPTADLDPMLQKEIMNFLIQVNKQGVTLVIASHHLALLERACNKIAIVHIGRVHSHGHIDEIRKSYSKDNFTLSLSPGDNKERLISILKTLPIDRIIDKDHLLVVHPKNITKTVTGLLTAIQEENLYLHDLDIRHPSLDEIFEIITSREK